MLILNEKIKFRLGCAIKNYEKIDAKVKEAGINIIISEPYYHKYKEYEMENWFWTCEAKRENFDELCRWLNEDFKGVASISRYI